MSCAEIKRGSVWVELAAEAEEKKKKEEEDARLAEEARIQVYHQSMYDHSNGLRRS